MAMQEASSNPEVDMHVNKLPDGDSVPVEQASDDNEVAQMELTEETPGTRAGLEEYILCGFETNEEWLRWQELDLRKRALLKLRREIADVFTTFTCGLACFLACITSLEEESKVQLSALLDMASETMMRFGTPDEADCFHGPIAVRFSVLECAEWCSNPYPLERFQDILDQLETGVKAIDYEDVTHTFMFSAKMVYPRGLTSAMVLLNRWINTARVILKQ